MIPVTDGTLPGGLPRAIRARAAAVIDAGGMGALYGVVTQYGAAPQRVVLVHAGSAKEASYDRLRKVASAGTRSLAGSRSKRIAIVVDPREAAPFWFADYFPEIRTRMFDSYAPLDEIEAHFAAGGLSGFEVVPFPLRHDFSDMNMHSGWNRPEVYLDAAARQNMSPFALAADDEVTPGVDRLRADLESGRWDAANGQLRRAESLDLGFRFIRASR